MKQRKDNPAPRPPQGCPFVAPDGGWRPLARPCRAVREPGRFLVRGGQSYRSPGRFAIEGDWSSAAFWFCAGALGLDLAAAGLDPRSTQGDRAVMDMLSRMGADVGRDAAGPVSIDGAEAVAKSYPAFWDVYEGLCG